MDKIMYLLFLVGLMLTVYPSVFWLKSICRTRWYMRRNFAFFGDEKTLKSYGRIGSHLRLLVQAADAEGYFPSVERFYIISGVLGILPVIFFCRIVPIQSAFLWGCFSTLLPYLVLQAQLHEKRVKRSKEGDVLVQELRNQYQICNYNILDALEKTAKNLGEMSLGKNLFLQLAKDLNHAVTKKEVENLLIEFRYAFDTVWGNVLASNIFFAHMYGIRVDEALEDLSAYMVQSRKAIEYSRRENHEAKMMLLWLAPMSFLLSIFFACHFFGFTLWKFLNYQLGTALGLQWFFAVIFCYVISLFVHGFLAKEKMDI